MCIRSHRKTNTCLTVTLTVENQNTTIVITYINPKDTLAENFIASIEELNLEYHQDLIIAGEFNAIDFGEYENLDEKVKSNDIRVLKHRAIITKLNEFVLADIGTKQIPVSTTHYDRRSKKHSRIDYCSSNTIEQNLELAVRFLPFSDHKLLHLHWNQNVFKNGYFRLNDSLLENKETVIEILKTSSAALEGTISLSKSYDIFKARLRDSLRLLCIREKRKKVVHEDNLVREIEKLESDAKQSEDWQKKSEILKALDAKISEFSEIKQSEAKLQMKKIKNLFLEANVVTQNLSNN